jgi:hypothetical protein
VLTNAPGMMGRSILEVGKMTDLSNIINAFGLWAKLLPAYRKQQPY